MLRTKKSISRLLLLLAGLAVGFILSEFVLWIFGVTYPHFYVPDPYCASRLRPGMGAWYVKEGRAYVKINSHGLRDREHSTAKPANTFRIAVLGDSYAEALQVPIEQTFWSVLERELETRHELSGKRIEVLNFGVSGYGTAQELQMLRHYVWPYEPDLVILAFLTGNDVRNNSKELELDDVRPYFSIEDGKLILDDSFKQHPTYLYAKANQWKIRLIDRFRILQLVMHVRNNWNQSLTRQAKVKHESSNEPQVREAGLDHFVYQERTDSKWLDAWQITERLILEMHKEVAAKGCQFLVVTLSNGIQVHPIPQIRETFVKKNEIEDLFYPDRRIETLGQTNNFPVILLARPMQAYAEKNNVFLHGFENTKLGHGHWNADGHRIAGTLIAAKICALQSR